MNKIGHNSLEKDLYNFPSKKYFTYMTKRRNYSLEEPIGFTRVSEDVLVPSWMLEFSEAFERSNKHPFKSNTPIWYGLAIFWLLLTILDFSLNGILVNTGIIMVLATGWYLVAMVPSKWLEINRKDGFITCWTSKKKKKLIAQAHIDQLAFKSVRRKISTNGRLGRIEYRYLICLEYNDNRKKKLFADLFDLFEDGKRSDEIPAEGFSVAWSLTQSIEQFVRKFMQGEPVPVLTKSSYKFKFK
jgi:hypothetical protein